MKVLLEVMPWLENEPNEKIDAMPGPRYIKTHNPYDNVAYDPHIKCKYIYIARWVHLKTVKKCICMEWIETAIYRFISIRPQNRTCWRK